MWRRRAGLVFRFVISRILGFAETKDFLKNVAVGMVIRVFRSFLIGLRLTGILRPVLKL